MRKMDTEKLKIGDRVATPLGKGPIVAVFRDGTVCVELEHGGGAVLHRSDIFKKAPSTAHPRLARLRAC